MASATNTPIVLIHGFWVTPRSWENWIAHYESKGHRVIAPAYPGFEVAVEALNADPTPIEQLTVPAIMARLDSVVGALDTPPILMGHSAGGVFAQLLLDRGYGVAGVAINSAPTEGVKVVPLSQIKAGFPVLKNPANRHRAVGFTYATPAVRTWSVDTTAPGSIITDKPPATTQATTASFGFASGEQGVSFECSLDNAAFTACSSPKEYTDLAVGQHTFRVRAIDAVGNVEPEPESHTWTVQRATRRRR